jgi:hypothetical protein
VKRSAKRDFIRLVPICCSYSLSSSKESRTTLAYLYHFAFFKLSFVPLQSFQPKHSGKSSKQVTVRRLGPTPRLYSYGRPSSSTDSQSRSAIDFTSTVKFIVDRYSHCYSKQVSSLPHHHSHHCCTCHCNYRSCITITVTVIFAVIMMMIMSISRCGDSCVCLLHDDHGASSDSSSCCAVAMAGIDQNLGIRA